jgi:hypothetical protein
MVQQLAPPLANFHLVQSLRTRSEAPCCNSVPTVISLHYNELIEFYDVPLSDNFLTLQSVRKVYGIGTSLQHVEIDNMVIFLSGLVAWIYNICLLLT